MKILKKFVSIILVMLLTCCISVGFVGCIGGTGPISNGVYADDNPFDEECYVYTKDKNVQTYFKIKDMAVSRVRDGVEDYRARIIVTENGIYFRGYKWSDFSSTEELFGYNDNYLVDYDKAQKSFTLTLVGYIE